MSEYVSRGKYYGNTRNLKEVFEESINTQDAEWVEHTTEGL